LLFTKDGTLEIHADDYKENPSDLLREQNKPEEDGRLF